eukprot:12889448-Alexandrium_andersonii.AAC.1
MRAAYSTAGIVPGELKSAIRYLGPVLTHDGSLKPEVDIRARKARQTKSCCPSSGTGATTSDGTVRSSGAWCKESGSARSHPSFRKRRTSWPSRPKWP